MKNYNARKASLETHQGNVHSLIKGQCNQVLLDKMKCAPSWDKITKEKKPTALLELTHNMVHEQTSDQCAVAAVYEQQQAMCGFQQNNLTNDQWCERFNTKVDVGKAVGVGHQHPAILEYATKELHKEKTVQHDIYETCNPDEKKLVEEHAEELCLACVMLHQSGKQHDKLHEDLTNDYTTGDDRYPMTRQ